MILDQKYLYFKLGHEPVVDNLMEKYCPESCYE